MKFKENSTYGTLNTNTFNTTNMDVILEGMKNYDPPCFTVFQNNSTKNNKQPLMLIPEIQPTFTSQVYFPVNTKTLYYRPGVGHLHGTVSDKLTQRRFPQHKKINKMVKIF